MNAVELRDIIKQELPQLVREDTEIQELILRLSRQEFAPRQPTEDRFEWLFAKLERDTEASNRRWEEQNRKWDENQAELRRIREDFERKWQESREETNRQIREEREETNRQIKEEREETNRQLRAQREESERKWQAQREESERKFQEHREEFNRVHEEIMAMNRRHDRTVGALGSRWGIASEKAFRDALASVLEKSFDVRVVNVNDYDDQGMVFGQPDHVELDVIITNGTLILMELKSSIDKASMYIFERKARFYEQRHGRAANRLMVISPMIDARARRVGERLGIEMFGDSTDVESLEKP